MSKDGKIWLIEPGDVLEVMSPAREPAGTRAKPAVRPPAQVRVRASTIAPRDTYRVALPRAPRGPMHFALLLPLTYLCGPLAILLTTEGRRQRPWVGLGLLSAAATAALLLVPFDRFFGPAGLAAPLAWSGLAALATAGAFSVWSRALHLAGERIPTPSLRHPERLRRPWVLAMAGLLAPGSGLLLAGRRLRGALVLWMLWPAALGGYVLANAGGIWRTLPQAVPGPRIGPALESVFIVAAAAVVMGLTLWIVQSLICLRQAAAGTGRNHGDWYAVALGVACAAMAWTADPALIARHLDEGADILHADRLRVIPLYLTLAAERLDPGQAAYAVQAIALYEELGRDDEAAAMRARLDEGLETYLALVSAEEAERGRRPATPGTGPAASGNAGPTERPAEPVGEPLQTRGSAVYYGVMVPPGAAAAVRDVPPQAAQ